MSNLDRDFENSGSGQIHFIVVVKKTFRYPNVFFTIETFVSTTTYAAIPYFGTLLWKAV
jgi:hypothetical protein